MRLVGNRADDIGRADAILTTDADEEPRHARRATLGIAQEAARTRPLLAGLAGAFTPITPITPITTLSSARAHCILRLLE